jgi:transcriptional regulator with XRE-family HTH domain
MKQHFDKEAFAKALKTKRVIDLNIGVREAAKKIGEISAATISRIENENPTDIDTVLKICRWIKQPITNFIKSEK